jgi:hypothetical protein
MKVVEDRSFKYFGVFGVSWPYIPLSLIVKSDLELELEQRNEIKREKRQLVLGDSTRA